MESGVDFRGQSLRTLRKRLRAERPNLHRLVSQAQFEIAAQLLKYTRLPISEIATALRFADLSTFSAAWQALRRNSGGWSKVQWS